MSRYAATSHAAPLKVPPIDHAPLYNTGRSLHLGTPCGSIAPTAIVDRLIVLSKLEVVCTLEAEWPLTEPERPRLDGVIGKRKT